MFSRILEQIPGRFGLTQTQARQLLGLLVAQVFNPKHGGPEGFVRAFRDAGLGATIDSWLGQGPNQAISPAQLESVLGREQLAGIGERLGLAPEPTVQAAAAMLPDAIDELSEHGDLPAIEGPLSERLRHWFGSIGVGLDQYGQWVPTPTAAAVAAAPLHTQSPAAPKRARDGTTRWLLWVLIGAAILAAALLPRGCHGKHTAETPDVGQAVSDTTDAAATALDRLLGGKFGADELVSALNLMVVQFDTDSARISTSSDAILKKAAAAIQAAPAGTRIEIGGHTDNTGDAGANRQLSQARAEAVRARLVELGVDAAALSSAGYGPDRPVADNATEAGRARNRRIEFSVMK